MVKNLPANARDARVTGSIPGSGRSLEVGNGNPPQYSYLGNLMTEEPGGDWEDLLEEEMATHSSILAGKIPWTEEPGGLQSMGSQRVGHD